MQVDIDHDIIIRVVYLLQQIHIHTTGLQLEMIIYGDEYQGHMKRCNDHVQSDIMYQVVKNGLDCRLCCDILVMIVRHLMA